MIFLTTVNPTPFALFLRMKSAKRWLLIAFLVETLCVTYALYVPSFPAAASVLYAVAGVAIAAMLLFRAREPKQPAAALFSRRYIFKLYQWLALVVALALMIVSTTRWINEEPLNYETADMLPIIKVMCERFLAGEWRHVYDPIPAIWHGTVPIYLPGMWLPFVLPVWIHVDPRWLTCALLFVLLVLFMRKFNRVSTHNWLIALCVVFLYAWIFYDDHSGFLPYTEEGVVVFFYSLLTIALLRGEKNVWMIGLCASLCALSRYALAGWLPAMGLYFVYRRQWKHLLQFAGMGLACFVLLVWLPFGSGMLRSFIGLPDAYIAFAARVWHDSPEVFSDGLGWARFFGKDHIRQQHQWLLVLTFGVPLVAMLLGLLLHKKIRFDPGNLPLAVFKLGLVIFFCMVDVPYLYLFYTSSFVSLFAVMGVGDVIFPGGNHAHQMKDKISSM